MESEMNQGVSQRRFGSYMQYHNFARFVIETEGNKNKLYFLLISFQPELMLILNIIYQSAFSSLFGTDTA